MKTINKVMVNLAYSDLDRDMMRKILNNHHILKAYELFPKMRKVSALDLIEDGIAESTAYRTLFCMRRMGLIEYSGYKQHGGLKGYKAWRLT